ncbi:MAG: class I SAM-dependent methyltransferase [Ktedonobacteraceae bacterium]
MDQQNTLEMARLLLQGRLITEAMGGIFPASLDLSPVRDVLDIACGPGGWVLDAAKQNATMQVTGIDLDRSLVEFGRTQAAASHLDNAHFRVMDATKSLKFPDGSFDFINARLLFGFMLPQKWSKLLQECFRMLRPGGIVRLTECEAGISSSPAGERLYGFLAQALKRAGQSFSPDGRTLGITPRLRQFLRDAGCVDLQHAAYAIDYSSGSAAHGSTYQDFVMGFKLIQPFFAAMGVATAEDIEDLYEQALVEMRAPDFCAIWFYLSAWGSKPF